MDYTNKTVWITGASSGIGEALVHRFSKLNANVILSSRRVEELERVQREAGLSDENALILPVDLTDNTNFNALADKVIAKFRSIDILVNNGGISQRSYATETLLEIDRKIMEVNYFGTIALTKSVLPHMTAKKSGHIITISSVAGKFGFYLRSSYSASKHALHGYFESLRMEVERAGIKVLLVCPGKVKTNISLHALKGDGQKHNEMDASQEQGVSASNCAKEIIEAIEKSKKEIYIGDAKGRIALLLKRFLPNLFYRVLKNQKPE